MVLTVDESSFSVEVLNSSTPVLVNFWAPWCGVCKLIDPFLTKLQSELDTPIKVVSINADENLRLANTYKLTTLPTILLFDNGTLRHRLEGFRSRSDLRVASDTLRSALDGFAMSCR